MLAIILVIGVVLGFILGFIVGAVTREHEYNKVIKKTCRYHYDGVEWRAE